MKKERSDLKSNIRTAFLILLIIFSATSAYITSNFSLSLLMDKPVYDWLHALRCTASGLNFESALVFIAICLLFSRFLPGKVDKTAAVLSFCYSLLLSIGLSYRLFSDARFFFASIAQFIVSLLLTAGNGLILYSVVKGILLYIDRRSENTVSLQENASVGSDRRLILRLAVIFLICWLPLELAFFPGAVPHDGRAQLLMYDGVRTLTNDHPFISTYVFGWLYHFFQNFLGQNAPFGIVLLQNISGALVFASICAFIRKNGASKALYVSSVVYYALLPAWWAYFDIVVKDTLFFVFYSWFILEYIRLLTGRYEKERTVFFRLAAAGLLTCAFRNNGILIVLPSLLILTVLFIKRKRKSFITGSVVTAAIALFMNIGMPRLLHVKKTNIFELLSIPVQQIARCVVLHGEEFSEEEIASVEKIMPMEIFSEYRPCISDYIKNPIKHNIQKPYKKNFLNVWFHFLKKYPLTYVDAAMNHVFGYTDPFYLTTELGQYSLYNKDFITENDKGIVYSSYAFSNKVWGSAYEYALFGNNIPGIQLLCVPGIYTWITILVLAISVRRKDKYGVYRTVPALLYIVGCFASPANGLMRYMLPVMATTPLMLGTVFIRKKEIK